MYQVEISSRFAVLESIDKSYDINNAWERIRENINTSANGELGYQKLKHNKQWFDAECSKLIDLRKQDKLQCLQNPKQYHGDDIHNMTKKPVEYLGKRKGNI
jgi:hypothetical protein